MKTGKWDFMALALSMQSPEFAKQHLTTTEQDPRVTELFNACVEYYRVTDGMSNRESQPNSNILRKLRYDLGLSAKDLTGCKQSAERHLIKLGELK